MNCYAAKILADSLNVANGKRLTTFEITYPRFVHAELMTHRMFCLAGDAVLEFDLPAGQNKHRKIYKMTIAEFVSKWKYGSKPHLSRWGTLRTYDLKTRLCEMQIRQLNEATGDIQTSTIVDAFESGIKPVYEIQAGKYKIAGSEDHRVMTVDGWKTIKEIKIGDQIVVSTKHKPYELKLDPLRLKKIDRKWRSTWQNQQRERLIKENSKCRLCNKQDGEDIHYIIPVYQDKNKVFDETNITLLCDECHNEQHKKQEWQTGSTLYSGLVVVDSIRFRGVEPTYDLSIAGPFPNFLANKIVVHNSRNAASSRAIPNEKLIERVMTNPAMPVWWGKNQAGMSANEELPFDEKEQMIQDWLDWRDENVKKSQEFAKRGLHKQLCNRLIETWMPITVIISATEYANWFHLRCHKDAQPEIRVIAEMMRDLYKSNQPKELQVGQWHRPLIFEQDFIDVCYWDRDYFRSEKCNELVEQTLNKISVGRCARVSYLTHDGKRELEKDVELCDRLSTSGHWSPFEHVAQSIEENIQIGNFFGWKQYRKLFPNENFTGEI